MRASCVPTGLQAHSSSVPHVRAPVEPRPAQPLPVEPQRDRQRPGRAFFGLGLALVTGCGSAGAQGSTDGKLESDCSYLWASESTLNILTWWETQSDRDCQTQAGEACAVRTLEDGYAECTPGASAVLLNKPTKESTLGAVADSVAAPAEDADGAIVNGGADVYRLADCQLGNSKLANLGSLDAPAADFLIERTPAELLHLVTCPDGRLFGSVLGLHRLNQLFYNRQVIESVPVQAALTAHGVDFGASLDIEALPEVLAALSDAGYRHALAIPDDSGTWSRFLIENVMVAMGQYGLDGRHQYTEFWSRLIGAPMTDRRIDLTLLVDTLEFVRKLAPYISRDDNAMDSMTLGERAVFTVTGDWEVPKLSPDVGYVPFPGTELEYVYTADVVVATKKHGAALDPTAPLLGWFKAVTSSAVQPEFALKKHALSPVVGENGRTRAKHQGELFVVDGRPLHGIAGLPSYVPHLTFDNLGPNIRDYMRCLTADNANVSSGMDAALTQEAAAPAVPACTDERDTLVNYVYEQYCWVISGSKDGCTRIEPPPGGAR